jgi:hypothetical protein
MEGGAVCAKTVAAKHVNAIMPIAIVPRTALVDLTSMATLTPDITNGISRVRLGLAVEPLDFSSRLGQFGGGLLP